MYKKINRIHLIGIGGIGMSGIAEILLRHGYRVSGSDLNASESLKQIEALGIRIFTGHRPENIEGAELVVYSSAIRSENPELAAAVSRQIPVIPRAEMLAELMRLKWGIAVAGAHGKTTTTSMIALALMEGDLDPTIVVGGRVDNFGGTNARLGSGEFMVVEADESDGSFNKLSPSIAVVTNLDREHMDYYKTMRRLKSEFLSFLNKVPFYGLGVICGDDPYLKVMKHRISRRKLTFGFSAGCDYQVESYEPQGTGSVSRVRIGTDLETLKLRVPGRHNLLNALAALVVADELSIPRTKSLQGLWNYQGVQRRFQMKGEIRGVQLIDDYAHHPREIRATLEAARERYPQSTIRVVFQPHRYSRVEDLFEEFSSCFKDCDGVAVTDIYAAGEAPIAGIESSILVDNIARRGHENVRYLSSPREALEGWLRESAPGDIILTMGAGDLPNVYKHLL